MPDAPVLDPPLVHATLYSPTWSSISSRGSINHFLKFTLNNLNIHVNYIDYTILIMIKYIGQVSKPVSKCHSTMTFEQKETEINKSKDIM